MFNKDRRPYALSCLIRVMKLTTFILLITFITVNASVYSQVTKLDLKVQSVTVKEVLSRIEDQSQFFFMYNDRKIDVERKVDLDLKQAKIEDLLKTIFEGTDTKYLIKDRQIVLYNESDQELSVPNTESSSQQQKSVSGKVTDSSGGSLPGVSVVVKGTTTGVITDMDGKYTLDRVTENATLQFSFVGMKTQEIKVGDKTTLNVTLADETVGIEEVVAVGYGTQKRESITGSIAAVKGEILSKAPVASASNSLAGQLPGLVSLQSSGQPGFDAALLSIRGFGAALIIVDGVETDFNSIDQNQIESVSILKDGAAAIYGSRAGNGVILVTTKRGNNGKPMFTLNSSFTQQRITAMPKPVNAGQYAEMTSEDYLNRGLVAPFTPEQIKKYYDGTDPQYPNTDWYNVLVRDYAPQQQHNISVRGGSDKIKYYGFVGYLDQKTMWKLNDGGYKRYNLQSNIDAKILDNLSLQLDLASTYEQRDYPSRSQNDGSVWADYWSTAPNYPSQLPDPTKVSYAMGAGTGGAHVTTNSSLIGYNNMDNQNFKGTLSLNYKFKQIDGLTAKAFVNLLQDYSQNKNFTKPVNFYTYDIKSDIYNLMGSLGTKSTLDQKDTRNRVLTGQLSLNYDHTFAKDHHISALALYEAIDYSGDWLSAARINFLTPSIDQMYAGSTTGMSNNGSATEMGRVSYVGRFNYTYKGKYLIESSLRVDGSAKFPEDNRWGYFPSVSLGWRMTEEGFMKNLKSFDNLKLRASYGESGLDNVGNFAYLSGFAYGGTYILGSDQQQGITSTGLANPNLTWENIAISNVGIDFSLWKRKLYGEADAFYRTLSGIPATRSSTLPSTFGAPLPPENINSTNDRGFEIKLGTSGSINEFKYDISGNVSRSRSKWDHFEEPIYTDPDQARIYTKSGQWTDNVYGYISDGLFTSKAQIDALPFDLDGQGNKSLHPGDIRYIDLNGDKKLDWKDQVVIGKGTIPHWMMGFNADLKYKQFELNALFQGAFGYYSRIVLQRSFVYPQVMYDLRWTEKNNDPNALVPRLGGAPSNGYASDYTYKEAGYVRLKSLSFAYNLPNQWLTKIKLSEAKIFLAGTNLFTLDKLKKYGVDPEAPSGQSTTFYPQQKTVTLGVNISF